MQHNANSKLDSIQILRAVAAIIVVFAHSIRAYTVHVPGYLQDVPQSWLSAPWFRDGLGFGVDIFFVISGFIMVHVSTPYAEGRKPASDFLLRRVERIYPPYLISTAFLLVLTAAWSGTASDDFSLWRIATSALLFPSLNANGLVQPILGIGWTLSYEMYFYLAFALALAIGRARYLPVLIGIIAAVWTIATIAGSDTAQGIFFRNPIVAEFLYGCLIAYLHRSGRLPTVPLFVVLPCIIVVFAASYLCESGVLPEDLRCIYWGAPAAVLLSAFIRLPVNRERPLSRLIVFLGDASYSIYLVHIIFIYQVLSRIYPKLAFHGLIRYVDQAVVMTFVTSVVAGIVFHLVIEKPTNDWRLRSRNKEKTVTA
ncbi:acyltransferase [Rhizobium sp. 9T]|uniref:Acyltransferase n=1 Tax=Rhizobium croatiense TaxID=2867516 RepID=A0ABS7LVJ8_9HYPH|nr:acyltransferase [Rhizobium croatiense]MBY4608118.1 acyltransferase [Rhizobium croatiense]MBY4628836.1 acyltransferase [Rhizobium croatiense]